jgi:hypothetical protein
MKDEIIMDLQNRDARRIFENKALKTYRRVRIFNSIAPGKQDGKNSRNEKTPVINYFSGPHFMLAPSLDLDINTSK